MLGDSGPVPSGEVRGELPIPIDGSLGLGWVEGWRGEVLVFGGWTRRLAAAYSPPRPFVAELATAGTCGDRQHRPRLSADQQVLQLELQRGRSLIKRALLSCIRY